MNDFYVYMLLRADGRTPFYVGKGIGNRWLRHEKHCHKHHDYKSRIIRKSLAEGKTIFKIKVAVGLTEKTAFDLEKTLIESYGRAPDGPLVNVREGGDGWTPTEATRAKLRAANIGKTMSPETRAKLSAARIGKAHSPEHRAAIQAALVGRVHSPEHRAKLRAAGIRRTQSSETRAKISASLRARREK